MTQKSKTIHIRVRHGSALERLLSSPKVRPSDVVHEASAVAEALMARKP